jgi:hypothetical protein
MMPVTRADIEDFVEWFIAQPHPHKVFIAGNHDLTLDLPFYEGNWGRVHRSKEDAAAIKARLIERCAEAGVHYLEDSGATVAGLQFYGCVVVRVRRVRVARVRVERVDRGGVRRSPHQPAFFNWAFGRMRGEDCRRRWELIPAGVDVLVTHGPPLGHGDLSLPSRRRTGCVDLLMEVEKRIKPKWVAVGVA